MNSGNILLIKNITLHGCDTFMQQSQNGLLVVYTFKIFKSRCLRIRPKFYFNGKFKVMNINLKVVAGTFCVTAGFLPDSMGGVQLVLGLIGKMGASAGYAVVYVYTAELFPTKVKLQDSVNIRIGGTAS